MVFSEFYFYNVTCFWKISISSIVSSSQTFYYLIWKNSKKVTKNGKKSKQNCQKVSQYMLTSAESLSKFAEGLRSHHVQLFFPSFFAEFFFICFLFILFTIYYFSFILCAVVLCTIMIFPLMSSSEWN